MQYASKYTSCGAVRQPGMYDRCIDIRSNKAHAQQKTTENPEITAFRQIRSLARLHMACGFLRVRFPALSGGCNYLLYFPHPFHKSNC